jgi:hypothetical protein
VLFTMRQFLPGILLFCAPLFAVARAAPFTCAESVGQWQLGRGELAADNACGSFRLTTDAQDHESTIGEASLKMPVHLPFTVSVKIRRLSPEGGRAMWLGVVGASLLFRDGAVGVESNAMQIADTSDHPLAHFDTHQEHLIAVAQTRKSIEVRIDGALVRTIHYQLAPSGGNLMIGLGGARGYRSMLSFRELTVSELAQ